LHDSLQLLAALARAAGGWLGRCTFCECSNLNVWVVSFYALFRMMQTATIFIIDFFFSASFALKFHSLNYFCCLKEASLELVLHPAAKAAATA